MKSAKSSQQEAVNREELPRWVWIDEKLALPTLFSENPISNGFVTIGTKKWKRNAYTFSGGQRVMIKKSVGEIKISDDRSCCLSTSGKCDDGVQTKRYEIVEHNPPNILWYSWQPEEYKTYYIYGREVEEAYQHAA